MAHLTHILSAVRRVGAADAPLAALRSFISPRVRAVICWSRRRVTAATSCSNQHPRRLGRPSKKKNSIGRSSPLTNSVVNQSALLACWPRPQTRNHCRHQVLGPDETELPNWGNQRLARREKKVRKIDGSPHVAVVQSYSGEILRPFCCSFLPPAVPTWRGQRSRRCFLAVDRCDSHHPV